MKDESDTLTKIRRLIGHLTDVKECGRASVVATERQRELLRRQMASKEAAAWDRVRNLPEGTTLYCCASGTFMGGPFQRGDSMEFRCVQPRAKRLWVKTADGKSYWFTPASINRYDLQLAPPANPISDDERKVVERITGRLNCL